MKKLMICFSLLLLVFLPSVLTAEDFEVKLMSQINIFRMSNDLPALVPNEELSLLAKDFSDLMVGEARMSHDIITDAEWKVMSGLRGVDRHCIELLVFAPTLRPNATKAFMCLRDSHDHKEGMLMKEGVACGIAYSQSVKYSYITVYVGGPDRRGEKDE